MAKKKDYTRVVFRVFKSGIGKGEIIALFIDDCSLYHRSEVASYMHVGQHAFANYNAVIEITHKATEKEYTPLLKELHKIGYRNLKVMQKRIKRQLTIKTI